MPDYLRKSISLFKNIFIKKKQQTIEEIAYKYIRSLKEIPKNATLLYNGYTLFPDFTVVHCNILSGNNSKEIGKINLYESSLDTNYPWGLAYIKLENKEMRLERDSNGKFKASNKIVSTELE